MSDWIPKLQPYQEQFLANKFKSAAFIGGHAAGKTKSAIKTAINYAKSGIRTVQVYTPDSPKQWAKRVRSYGISCRAYRENVIGMGWKVRVVTSTK